MPEVRNELTDLCEKMDEIILQAEAAAKALGHQPLVTLVNLMHDYANCCYYAAQDGIDFTAPDFKPFTDWQFDSFALSLSELCPHLELIKKDDSNGSTED